MKLNMTLKTLMLAALLNAGAAMANHHEGGEHNNKMEDYKMSNDANKDGKLTYDEYKMYNEKNAKMKFDHMDANKDGTLDEAELKTIHEIGHDGMGECKHHNMQKEPAASKT